MSNVWFRGFLTISHYDKINTFLEKHSPPLFHLKQTKSNPNFILLRQRIQESLLETPSTTHKPNVISWCPAGCQINGTLNAHHQVDIKQIQVPSSNNGEGNSSFPRYPLDGMWGGPRGYPLMTSRSWSLQSPICPSDSFSNVSICRALTMISSGSSQYSHSRCPPWPSIYLCHRQAADRHVKGEILNIPTCLSHSLFHNATGPWMWPHNDDSFVAPGRIRASKTHVSHQHRISNHEHLHISTFCYPLCKKLHNLSWRSSFTGDVRSTAAGTIVNRKMIAVVTSITLVLLRKKFHAASGYPTGHHPNVTTHLILLSLKRFKR